MQLSEHFSFAELNIAQDAPQRIVDNAKYLCEKILEPIRAHFCEPMNITSGYRPPYKNAQVHGVHGSEHLFNDDHAAADFQMPGIPLSQVFFWIRMVSGLPFRQVILEFQDDVPSVIHVSCQVLGADKREALVGETHNSAPYKEVEVA